MEELCEFLADRQAQTGSSEDPGGAVVCLYKAFEYLFEFFRFDAYTAVFNRKPDTVALVRSIYYGGREVDGAFFGEFLRIGQQVHEDLMQAKVIADKLFVQ